MPFFNNSSPPEYNLRGDSANGVTGSQTAASMRNAAAQGAGAKPGENPFQDFLSQAMLTNQRRQAIRRPQGVAPVTPQGGSGYNTGIVPQHRGGSPVPPPQGAHPYEKPPIETQPPLRPVFDTRQTFNWQDSLGDAMGNQPVLFGDGPAEAAGGRRRSASPGNPSATEIAKPPGVSDGLWNDALRYVREGGPEYEWLLTNPHAIAEYRAEAEQFARNGQANINFTDWARMKGYASSVDRGTGANAGGYFEQKAAEYSTHAGPWQGAVTPQHVKDYHAWAQQAAQNGETGVHFTDWWNRGRPAQYGQQQGPPDTRPGGGGAPGGGSGGGAGGGVGGGGSAGTQPPAGARPTAPQFQQWNPSAVQMPDIAAQLREYFDPMFQSAQGDLDARLRHNAAVTGAINSGGYHATYGKAMGDLVGEQQAQLGGMAFQAQQAQLDRTLKDNQFRNQFELDKWANENKFELERMGLDVERYKADQSYRAAVAQANAMGSAASAQANASMYGDDIRYRLGLLGYDVDRENNWMRNQLGFAQLGPEYLQLILAASPDAFINGGLQIPGDVIVRP